MGWFESRLVQKALLERADFLHSHATWSTLQDVLKAMYVNGAVYVVYDFIWQSFV